MKNSNAIAPPSPMVLTAEKAADLMTPNPVSIRETATVAEAVRLLTQKGFSAAPVIDEAGRAVGVLSQTDLLVHANQAGEHKEKARVRDLMTPVVFAVQPNTPVPDLIQEMTALQIHRVFVVDADGVLVGVVSALDVVRKLFR